jgi:hypothetical protein
MSHKNNTEFKLQLNQLIEQINSDSNLNDGKSLTLLGYYISSQIFIKLLEKVNNDWHKYNKVYRDLNLTNISLINGLNNDFDIELREEGVGPQTPLSDEREDQRYFPFEVHFNRKLSTKTDIWSLGKIMSELFDIKLNE